MVVALVLALALALVLVLVLAEQKAHETARTLVVVGTAAQIPHSQPCTDRKQFPSFDASGIFFHISHK